MEIIKIGAHTKSEIIQAAVAVLKSGGLMIYPTETCYGVGVMATSQEAVDHVLAYKHRPEGKAISIAVADKVMAQKYVDLNPVAVELYDKFLPGPVTVISQSKNTVAVGLASEKGTIGIRIPDYKLMLAVIKHLGAPITSTSANSAGKKTPYTVCDIFANISNKQKKMIDLVIDAGELPHNPPSTVIDTTRTTMQIIRKGSLLPGRVEHLFKITSAKGMQSLGAEFISQRQHELPDKCLLVLFNGELGTGKTQFVKGLATGLGISDNVNSPTYSLIKEYDFGQEQAKLVHVDAWRLESVQDFKELHMEHYFIPGNVIVVEWSGAAREAFAFALSRKDVMVVEVEISYTSATGREVKIYE